MDLKHLPLLAAPLALVIALVAPGAWLVVPVAAAVLLVLTLIDAARAGHLAEWKIDHDADVEIGLAVAVEVDGDLDLGFQRVARDAGFAFSHGCLR